MPEPTVRPLEPADVPGALELMRRSLGPAAVPRSEALWRWKHLDSPFGPSPGLVAESGGELVALRVFLRWRWRDASGERPAVRAVDTATHPDFRGRGLFTRLTRELVERLHDEGCHFVFNTPNRASRAGYLKMGWRDVARVPVRLRPVPGARLRRPAAHHSFPDLPFPTVDELLGRPELPALLARRRPGDRLHTPRDLAYLRWRYAGPPGLRYHALWLFRDDTAAALVLRARERRGLREVSLSEILVDDQRQGIALAGRLLRRVARESGADYLAACAAPGTPERRAVGRAGFLPWGWPGPRLTARPLGPPPAAGADPLRIESWRFSVGDLEIF